MILCTAVGAPSVFKRIVWASIFWLALQAPVLAQAPQLIGSLETHGALFAAPKPSALAQKSMIPQARIAKARGMTAWFGDATGRYRHAVLGDAIEAESLYLERTGALYRFSLERSAVFEDLEPRFVDIDRDGQMEILAIKASLSQGAAIALYGLNDGALRELATSPPIGQSNRWLNPIGVADFDGDGVQEIAIIRTPHIGGILIHYEWSPLGLTEKRRIGGYSNHRIGSTVLNSHSIIDWDQDGVMDHIIPRQNRSILAVVSSSGGVFSELASFAHGSEINSRLVQKDISGDAQPELVYATADGAVWALSPPQ